MYYRRKIILAQLLELFEGRLEKSTFLSFKLLSPFRRFQKYKLILLYAHIFSGYKRMAGIFLFRH